MLKAAEAHTTKELEKIVQGEEPVEDARVFQAYFSPKDYAVLDKALALFGGERSGRGFVNKEEAVMSIVRYALRKRKEDANEPMAVSVLQSIARRIGSRCVRASGSARRGWFRRQSWPVGAASSSGVLTLRPCRTQSAIDCRSCWRRLAYVPADGLGR